MRAKVVNIIIFLSLIYLRALATHIVGGEIYYTCLGNNNYKITLKLYRDCFNGQAPFDSPAYVGIFDASGTLVNTLSMYHSGATNVPPMIISPCLIPPTNICVEEAVYEQTINLPDSPGGYDIVYQRCCRNGTITNLDDPGSQGASYWAHIPDPSLATCNSSPRYNSLPPLFLCSNVSFNFDHMATDPDGDLLVYSFCTPYSGGSTISPAPNPPAAPPLPIVNYLPGYNGTYPIDANPPLTINNNTGYITGTPINIGQYVMGVCVSEYRNGVLLSTNKRDYQFNIVSCDAAIASIPAQSLFCNGYTVNFTAAASVNANTYFWDFGDLSTNADTSNLVSTTYTYPDSGIYTVMLVAYDPAGNCYDTTYANFEVYPVLEPMFIPPPPQCFDNNSFNFTAGGSFTSDATFLWDFGPNSIPTTSTLQNPTNIHFGQLGANVVTLTVSQYGCTKTYTDTIKTAIKPTAEISTANQYCVGNQVDFGNNSQNSSSWFWDFGVNSILSDTSRLFEPQYFFPDSGIYNITLIAYSQGVCSDTTHLLFWVFPKLSPEISGAEDQCLLGNSYDFSVAGAYTTDATFNWNFGPTASIQQSTLANPQGVSFSDYGYYPITLTVSQYGCSKTVSDSVGLFHSPEAKFVISQGSGCAPIFVQLTDSSTSDTPLIYHWNLGDNNSSNVQNPNYTYQNPGTYTISLTIISTSGCIDTTSYIMPNVVNVISPPQAGFYAEPSQAGIFDPIVTFIDTSHGAVHCALQFSDGTWVDRNCNYTHTFSDTGVYKVTQIVKNELDCVDSVSITVYIYPEFRLFIPDAFTPNGDGLNDIFIPSTIGIKEFNMKIINRWGEQIFETHSVNGWDGTYKGVNSPQGVYVYLLNVIDIRGNSHIYNGKVVLLR